MTFTLAKDRSQVAEPRAAVIETLTAIMGEREDVVALEADLGGASGFLKLKKAFPKRFIDCGIAEANMIGVAAGMASEGFTPFCHTFAPFATRRAFDQIYMSAGYAANSINIWGSDPGFSVAHNGGTHTSYEDMALMRTIPGSWVVDACDATQMAWVVRAFCAEKTGVHYVRAQRKAVRNVYEPGSTFEIGKGNLLIEGEDILIVATGQLVSEALDVAQKLEEEHNVSASVVDMFCVKPLDRELVLSQVRNKKLVVTVENHGAVGGLSEAVGTVLAQEGPGVPLLVCAPHERFGQVGSVQYLQQEYGLDADSLYSAVVKKLAL